MKTMTKKTGSAGFTLIEMIVTVTISAILASIAVPSFTKMIERNRISSSTNEFVSALILARSEAVKRSQNVSICVSSDQQTCDTVSKDYAKGWIVFFECNGAGATAGVLDSGINVCDGDGDGVEDDAPEQIIKVHNELPRLSIKSSDVAFDDFMSYDFSGRSADFSFYVGKDAANRNKEIDLSLTGRVQTCDYSAVPAGC